MIVCRVALSDCPLKQITLGSTLALIFSARYSAVSLDSVKIMTFSLSPLWVLRYFSESNPFRIAAHACPQIFDSPENAQVPFQVAEERRPKVLCGKALGFLFVHEALDRVFIAGLKVIKNLSTPSRNVLIAAK